MLGMGARNCVLTSPPGDSLCPLKHENHCPRDQYRSSCKRNGVTELPLETTEQQEPPALGNYMKEILSILFEPLYF